MSELPSADTDNGTRPASLVSEPTPTPEHPSASEVSAAASEAGTPDPSRSRMLSGGERFSALARGYVEHFTQWGGFQHSLSLLGAAVSVWALAASSAAVAIVGAAVVLLAVGLTPQKKNWIGRFPAARLLVLPSAAVDGATTVDLSVLLVAILLITGEAFLSNPARKLPSPPAANLVGMTALPDISWLLRGGLWASLAAEFALVAFLTLGSTAAAVAALIVMVAVLVAAAASIKLVRARHHRMVIAKFDALAAIEPRFLVHWDGPVEGTYQVAMWSRFLTATGLPFAVVVRNDRHVLPMAETTGVPVIHIGDSVDVDRSILPTLLGIVYVNTSLKNGHYIRFTHLKHIQINHGDSDKPASASQAFRMFDANLVAGQAAVDRFEHYGVHMPPELIRVVGRPQVEEIEGDDRGARDTVLYAPTWAGFFGDSDFSSLRQGELIVEALLARGKTVIFRPHSFTDRTPELAAAASRIRARLKADRAATGRAHIVGRKAEKEMSIVDCFNRSDAMIADVSSIVSDYLFSEKPLAMVAANTTVESFRSSFPVSRNLYVIDGELATLDGVLDDMLGEDSNRAARVAAREHYLGDFPRQGYSQHFVDALREELLLGGTAHRG